MKAKSKNQTSTAAKKSSTGKPHNQTSTAASVAAASSPDAHTAISAFKRQLAPMLQNQQKGLVLAGNSKDDCQQKQQAVVHVTDATKDVVTMAQKMHDAIGDSRKERMVEFSNPLVKQLALAICKPGHADKYDHPLSDSLYVEGLYRRGPV